MKKLVLYTILLCVLGFLSSINAQKLDCGIFIGGNYNFLTQRSDYEIFNKNDVKPSFSFSLGGYAKSNYEKINLLGSIEYSRISNKCNQTFTDPSANYITDAELGITNHYILISAISTLKIGKGIYIGAGLSCSILIWSSLRVCGGLYKYKFDGNSFVKGDYIGAVFSNHNYKRVLPSIPVMVGYNINRINLFARLNVGIVNRVKDESFVKEFETPLVLGIGYNMAKN